MLASVGAVPHGRGRVKGLVVVRRGQPEAVPTRMPAAAAGRAGLVVDELEAHKVVLLARARAQKLSSFVRSRASCAAFVLAFVLRKRLWIIIA